AGQDHLLARPRGDLARRDRVMQPTQELLVALAGAGDLEREQRLRAVGEERANDRHRMSGDVVEPERRTLDVGHPTDAGSDLEFGGDRAPDVDELTLGLEAGEKLPQIGVGHAYIPERVSVGSSITVRIPIAV